MKLMKINKLIIIIGIFFSACLEEIDLNIDKNEPILVVESTITDLEGLYYVRLTYSTLGLNLSTSSLIDDSYEAVKNANIIISDDKGNSDVLIPVPVQICYSYIYDETGNITDSVITDCENPISYERGYYQTTQIKGMAGNTYTLNINVNNKEYTANAFMPEVPKIDSLTFIVRQGEKEEIKLLVPLIYFTEPDEKNYYLFQVSNSSDIIDGYTAYGSWGFSILSDEFLPNYVLGLNISSGSTPGNRELSYYYQASMLGSPIINPVKMSSLTEEAYNYYKSLINQFNNDGGAYSSAPATPKGNISNGALGFFRASSVSLAQDTFYIDNMPMKK